MEDEIWKDIINFEGLYQISNYGNVKSLSRQMWNGKKYWLSKERILKYDITKKGYLIIQLRKNDKRKHFLIHRLVAIHFIENPNNYLIVKHKDNNPSNCYYKNLEWSTQKQNVQNAWRNGLCETQRNKMKKPVYQIDKNTNEIIREWESIKEAQIEYCIKSGITGCCKGKLKTAGGFKWKYK
jgi:hypothetical protein